MNVVSKKSKRQTPLVSGIYSNMRKLIHLKNFNSELK